MAQAVPGGVVPVANVLAGAGLSTASGIPDYRSADGLWKRIDPQEFHVLRLLADPDRFWLRRVQLIRESGILEAEPNRGHRILAEAVRQAQVRHIITQNVDGLHHKAGTPADAVIEVHGDSARSRCMDCGVLEDTARLVAVYDGHAPRCACGGVLRPNVVLFGEPVTRLEEAMAAVTEAERLVVVGTSLQVWPVAGIVQHALEQDVEVIIANRDPTAFDAHAAQVIRADVAEALATLFPDAAQAVDAQDA